MSHDPFPPKMHTKLYYNDVLTLSAPNTSLSVEQIYSLNSLFDPDVTGAGHQPYGFDTCAVLYTNYMATGCLVELEYFDPSADGLIVGYQVQGTTVSGLAANVLQERPWTDSADLVNTGSQRHTFRIYVPNNRALGLYKMQYLCDTNQYGALVSASPAQQAYIRLFAVSPGGVVITTKVNVKLTYFTNFWNRNTLPQS